MVPFSATISSSMSSFPYSFISNCLVFSRSTTLLFLDGIFIFFASFLVFFFKFGGYSRGTSEVASRITLVITKDIFFVLIFSFFFLFFFSRLPCGFSFISGYSSWYLCSSNGWSPKMWSRNARGIFITPPLWSLIPYVLFFHKYVKISLVPLYLLQLFE